MTSFTSNSVAPSVARRAILLAGLACGVCDIGYGFIKRSITGENLLSLVQGVLSALTGASAFQGGLKTAAIGLVLHFCVAITIAAVFYLFARKFPIILKHPILFGVLFGALAYPGMYWGVISFCGYIRSLYMDGVKVSLFQLHWNGLLIHIFFVGLPISLVMRKVLGAPIENPPPSASTDIPPGAPSVT